MKLISDICVVGNFSALMRHGGKLVPGSRREGHNIFTVTGRNFLAKLVAWQTIGATDVPYTQRRIRWIGVGIGSQLEVATVAALNQPVLATTTQYLVTPQTVEFPTSSSVRFIREFALNEITVTNVPVAVSEAGMFADVNPAEPGNPNDGYEDVAYSPGVVDTVLNPALGSNPPVAYKAFEVLTKTVDFTLEIRWDFRVE
jgi:hypothetical protein